VVAELHAVCGQRPRSGPPHQDDAACRLRRTGAGCSQLSGRTSARIQRCLVVSNQAVNPERIQALLQRLASGPATLDRTLALTWLEKNVRYNEPPLSVMPDKSWHMRVGSAGETYWAWRGKEIPSFLTLSGAQPPLLSATINFQSAQAPTTALTVEISRKLLRLVPSGKPFSFSLEEVGTQALSTESLYLDLVTLSSEQRLIYGMLDVPLPPGADVERTTWGLTITGQESASLNKAINEPGELSYGVPVEKLLINSPFEVRHLVKFSQKGQFTLPPGALPATVCTQTARA
jgi:alpha-2-macroglobulin